MQSRFNFTAHLISFCFLVFSFGTILEAQQTLCQQVGQNFVPTVVIGTNEFSITTSSSLGVSGWSNENVEVNGTFKVNSNFLISYCTLKMGKNAKIEIESNNTFTSWISKYFHCGTDYWTGFVIQEGSTSSSKFTGNHIEDANRVFDIKSGSSNITIFLNKINRNKVGIYAENISLNAFVAGNVFDCTQQLNSGFPYASAGIHLHQCPSATIGVVVSSPFKNIFRKQIYGIWLYNTTASIGLSDFYDNYLNGVNGDYSIIEIRGHNTSLRNSFRKNRKDIEAYHSNLYVFYCSFDSCQADNITSKMNNSLQRVHISENLINMTLAPEAYPSVPKTGIILDRSLGGSDEVERNIIERNHITIQDFGDPYPFRGGIYVNGGIGISDYMRIERDTIDMHKGGSHQYSRNFIDVNVSSSDHFVLKNNLLRGYNTFADGKTRWGFHLHNGDNNTKGNLLLSNTIFGDGVFDGGCCAVHCVNSGPWSICNNWTDHTYRGLHFMGNCGQSVVGLNTINDHDFFAQIGSGQFIGTGLLVQGNGGDNGFIGDQTCQGNEWTIPIYPSAAWAAQVLGNMNNLPSPSTVSKNEFFVDNINNPNQAPLDRQPTNSWFFDAECFTVPVCVPTGNEQEPRLNEHDMEVIDYFPQPQISPSASEWEDTRQLMKKLMRYPQLATSENGVSSFRNAYTESSAGRFARFDSMLNATLLVTSIYQIAMNDIEDAIKDKQAEINDLDATVTDFSNPGSTFFVERATLLTQLGNLSNQRAALLAQILAEREPLLLACEQFNTALPENAPYEQNQKLLNTLVIKYSWGIEFSEADYNVLHSMAQQCYETAWRTRDRAAALLPPAEAAEYWREDPDFSDCGESREQKQAANRSFTFKLSPNPATDNLRISFEKPFSGNLTVSDCSGKIVLFVLDVSEKHTVDVSIVKLPPGVYVLSSNNTSDALSVNDKFVIIR